MATNSRPLHTFELVEHFLINALDYNISKANYNIIPQIVATELNIENFDDKHITLRSKAYRNAYHRLDKDRIALKNKIVAELLTKPRLDNDDKITLGNGGAIPKTGKFSQDGNAYIIIGLPASGKSGIAEKVAEQTGSIILDSDYAKRKLPEFNCLPFGATLVHEESDEIINGISKQSGYESVFEVASRYNINLVIPKIGNNFSSLEALIEILESAEYKIHLTLVQLDRKKATQRALERFRKTKRYVPLGLIFDSYSNNPTITYYRVLEELSEKLSSHGIVSTDVELGSAPKVVSSTADNPAKMKLI